MPAPKQEKRPDIDWEAVEREYRAAQLSVSEIGRIHGLSHTAINKRAKKEGWLRDLSQKVREVVSARLVSEGVSAQSLSETVQLAAERDIQIIREHRSDIKSARELAKLLLDQLREAAQNRDAVEETIEEAYPGSDNARKRNAMLRAVGLPSHAGVISNLATALKGLVAMERQAFNMGDGESPEDEAKKAARFITDVERARALAAFLAKTNVVET